MRSRRIGPCIIAFALLLDGCSSRQKPAAVVRAPAAQAACQTDLEAAIRLLPKAYAGYQDKVAALGQGTIARAVGSARAEAQSALGAEECDSLMERWLATFRDGHVTLHSPRLRKARALAGRSPEKAPPAFVTIDGTTGVLKIPSFNLRFKRALEALLSDTARNLQGMDLLVIDLRGNSGGADSTYAPLIPFLYTGPIKEVGVDALAGAETAAGWERIMHQIPATETEVREHVSKLATKIREAPAGTFVSVGDDTTIALESVPPFPKRVAIFADAQCASTCEQFLLLAKQSSKVTLFGMPTAGVLDYANVRSFPLPSGDERVLSLATTRSRRLPAEPVDGHGIKPHVALEPATLSGLSMSELARLASQRLGTGG